MHATIIARRGVLRVRPGHADRAGALGLPADGLDTDLAEDLVQTALARLYVAWPKVRRAGTESAYVWRIIVNAPIDEVRRPGRRRERHVPELPESPAPPEAFPDGLGGGRFAPRWVWLGWDRAELAKFASGVQVLVTAQQGRG